MVEGETARYSDVIEADPRFEVHPSGHTKKVLRYQSLTTGEAIALEKRKGPPVLYVAHERQAVSPHIFEGGRVVPSGRTGRNSNLQAAFGEGPLFAIRPQHDVDFLAVLGCVL